MKVYFISSGLQGCYFVRCLMPLMANGWDGDQTSIKLENRTPENKTRAAQDANVIVFHRPDDPQKLKLARILKGIGKKIVYDNDDTFKDDGGFRFNEFMNKERLESGLKRINETLDDFIREADLVTCSTQFLAEEYKKLNDNVKVLPNCIDPFYFDEPLRNETDEVRIGVTGSVAITSDMEVLEPIVRHFHDKPNVKIVLFSMPPNREDKMARELYADEYKFWESVNIEWQPFVDMDQYYDTLNNLKLDIMIIPRADTYFNRAKSNIKFLEASMLEIPVIAQGFADGLSPYQDPEDSKHMKIVVDNKDWIPTIQAMIDDKEGRRAMAQQAHEYVLGRYDINDNAHLWDEAYESLYADKN
jgi:hypothetical protein